MVISVEFVSTRTMRTVSCDARWVELTAATLHNSHGRSPVSVSPPASPGSPRSRRLQPASTGDVVATPEQHGFGLPLSQLPSSRVVPLLGSVFKSVGYKEASSSSGHPSDSVPAQAPHRASTAAWRWYPVLLPPKSISTSPLERLGLGMGLLLPAD